MISVKNAFNNISAAGLLLILPLLSFHPAEKQNINIVFIGDSITDGDGMGDRNVVSPPARTVAYLKKNPRIGNVHYLNHGVSGFTTVDFLPATSSVFPAIVQSADSIFAGKKDKLLFSIMLGTNDSAMEGTNGSPVSAQSYSDNMRAIIDYLLNRYPDSKIIIQFPIWYSPNTYNGAKYLSEGLQRLKGYYPAIEALVKNYAAINPHHVFEGDKSAFAYFEKHHLTHMQHEPGNQGTFYLHPNVQGASQLGQFWGKAIEKMIIDN